MTPQWQQVKELFNDALDVAPAERARFLDDKCREDVELRREVESLLSSSEWETSFLESPAIPDLVEPVKGKGKRLEPGDSLGHYEIVGQIGSGGMGEVYSAIDRNLGRQVAVKILNQDFNRHESNLRRFIQEAKLASALNHPNILVIHEIGETTDSHYIISEFIDGKTLREVLKERTLSLSEVLEISIQTANALAVAHRAHLIHRDIKPENIMIRPDGYAKILDFGLAKLVEQNGGSVHASAEPTDGQTAGTIAGDETTTLRQGQTALGVILGTVNYMSPEQAKGEPVDGRTDIFSLGAVIYEMIAGRTPFAGDSNSETLANLTNAEPEPFSSLGVRVPDEFERLVAKAVRKSRDERYQTMDALLSDLRALSSSSSVKRGTVSEDVYWLYLQGKCLVGTHSPVDARAAVEYFENAIGLDPVFAAAYAGLAQAHVIASHGGGGSQSELMNKAKDAANRALEIDASLGEGHAVLGEIEYLYEWDFEKAEKSFLQAVHLDPRCELAHSIYGEYLASVGRFSEAIPEIRIAYEIDPKSCANQVIHGRILYLARRFDEANVQFKRVIEIFPQWTTANGWIWLVYEMKGDYDKAFEWLIINQQRNNVTTDRIETYETAWRQGGWGQVGEKMLEMETSRSPTANFYATARNYVRVGKHDLAMEFLKKAFDNRQYQMTWLNVDPFFDPLRGDPRFDELVRSVGLP